jgi:anhydro-N-acetylmuramic acid kinase
MITGLYIGAMTGTSMDGIDVVLLDVSAKGFESKAFISHDIPDSLRTDLLELCSPGDNEIQRSGNASVRLAREIAEAVNKLLAQQRLNPKEVHAIGSHGQTIRHSVDTDTPFTLQIGDPSLIAELTGITTIADFRMADIAAGGQGAPLAPAFHHAVFSSQDQTRLIINLGGIANITFLPSTTKTDQIIGYDTGPANTLMDQWINHINALTYDQDGEWAKSGHVIDDLLQACLTDPYFRIPPPKSTGRERFNLPWLATHLGKIGPYKNEDVQRTLLELTVQTLAKEIKTILSPKSSIYICGGGIENTFLIERLKAELASYDIKSTSALGIHPQQVEATAFAWLAFRTLNRMAGNLPTVTGADKEKVLGAIYNAS